jgi:hypothetical protein
MGKASTTSSLSLDRSHPSQLKTLLGLATHAEGGGGPLPAQAADPVGLRRLLTEVCRGQGESGDLLLETVCDRDVPLEVLQGIKQLAKDLVASAATDGQRHAATILYHAAIAGGFARYGVNLSSRPIGDRQVLYEDLAAVLAAEPLGGVFTAAVEAMGVR